MKICGIAGKQNEALKVILVSDNFKVHTLLRAVCNLERRKVFCLSHRISVSVAGRDAELLPSHRRFHLGSVYARMFRQRSFHSGSPALLSFH